MAHYTAALHHGSHAVCSVQRAGRGGVWSTGVKVAWIYRVSLSIRSIPSLLPCAEGVDTNWASIPENHILFPASANHSVIVVQLSDVPVVLRVAVHVDPLMPSQAERRVLALLPVLKSKSVAWAWDGRETFLPRPSRRKWCAFVRKKWMFLLHWSPAEAIDYILSPWCSKFCRQGADMLGLNLSRFITGKD